MRPRLLVRVCLFLSLPYGIFAQSAARRQAVPPSCPATRQFQTSLFIPPYPYPAAPGGTAFWFGSDRLWTSLPADGVWGGARHKLCYWRTGYNARSEQRPALVVTGRRLDDLAASPLVTDDHANNGWTTPDQPFMITGINLPSPGCWEITGRYHGEELTFVVWVKK